eukprot:scaffold625_cov324-Pavlova_lutheri.AAC.38
MVERALRTKERTRAPRIVTSPGRATTFSTVLWHWRREGVRDPLPDEIAGHHDSPKERPTGDGRHIAYGPGLFCSLHLGFGGD